MRFCSSCRVPVVLSHKTKLFLFSLKSTPALQKPAGLWGKATFLWGVPETSVLCSDSVNLQRAQNFLLFRLTTNKSFSSSKNSASSWTKPTLVTCMNNLFVTHFRWQKCKLLPLLVLKYLVTVFATNLSQFFRQFQVKVKFLISYLDKNIKFLY